MKKILTKDLVYFLLGIYLFTLEVAQNTVLYNISFAILVCSFLLMFVTSRKIKFNTFIFCYLLYILFQLSMYIFNIPPSNLLFLRSIKNLFLLFAIIFMIYNIIINDGRMDNFMKMFIIINFFALILILFLSRNTLLTQRLAHSYAHQAPSFNLFGIPVYMSSNEFAMELAVSCLFSLYFYNKEKKFFYLFASILFIVGNLLTGSRKGILLLLFFIVWWFNEKNKGKYFKKILLTILIVIVSYFSVMKVPVLYNIVGERLVELQNYIFNDELSSSVRNRDAVKDMALEKIKLNIVHGYGEGAFFHFFSGVTQSNSENNYLELLIHGGIIGLFIYYFYVFGLLKNILFNKNKQIYNKMFITIMISLLLIQFGTVHYNSIKTLIIINIYFANLHLEKKKEGLDNVEQNYILDKESD